LNIFNNYVFIVEMLETWKKNDFEREKAQKSSISRSISRSKKSEREIEREIERESELFFLHNHPQSKVQYGTPILLCTRILYIVIKQNILEAIKNIYYFKNTYIS
jgi:hypothetical protein